MTLRTDPRPPPARQPAQRRAIWLAVSFAAHVAALAGLLLWRPAERERPVEPSYDLVFQDGSPDRPGPVAPEASQAPPTAPETPTLPDALPTPGPETPTPMEPPAPDAPPAQPEASPPAAAPEPPAPEPPAPSPAPEPPTPLPLQPEPAPQAAAPTLEPPPPDPTPEPEAPRPPPAVRLGEPEPLPSPLTPQNLVPDLALTVPPMPPPAPPRPPTPPRAVQRPPALDSRFASPMDLNFGPAPSRPPPARSSVASRAIDLSPGPPRVGPNRSEAFFDARAAKLGADWTSGLETYWLRHRFYPRQAAQNGEDGTVEVELVVNRLGKVESVEVKRRSGSPWLDMAALSTWRGAQLAPLPAETKDDRVTLTLTINYMLVR